MVSSSIPLFIAAFILQVTAQSFNIYPQVNSTSLANAFGIDEGCLQALNKTLPCDQTLFQMVNTVDNYWWQADNLTALCTNECQGAVWDWNLNVQSACGSNVLTAYGKLIPADSVAGRYAEGMNIACLTNGNTSVVDADNVYCLLESQNWVGSDVVRPDCTHDPTNPTCTNPTTVSADNERLANLYPDSVLCSECFIQMMFQRLSSPYLPDHDYSNYLVSQYQDILDVCQYNMHMPELVITAQPTYLNATPPLLNISQPAAGCSGQTTVKSSLSPGANCATIAQAFNVPTGSVQFATKDPNCVVSQQSICLPPPCTLKQVPTGASCDSLAKSASVSNLTVSTVQFLQWNPNINGLCDSLTPNEFYCAGAPGGTYIPPPPPPGIANASSQARGGGDGSNTTVSTSTSAASSTSSASSAPSPTQTGIMTGCTKYNTPKSGDGCEQFAAANNITPTQLYAWNTVLGTNGANCGTKFFLGYYYCVAGPAVTSSTTKSSTTTTTTPTSTTSASAAPSPTQSGIASSCNKYAQAKSGEYCSLFASEYGISTDNLYKWNTVLGNNGANCSTQFFLGYYYCIGVK